MGKTFNVNANCEPDLHYMVDISERIGQIKAMVDAGQYFTINRARQYGKTTVLLALGEGLKKEYTVVSLDFQLMSTGDFEEEKEFTAAFADGILENTEDIPEKIRESLEAFADKTAGECGGTLSALFKTVSAWCAQSDKKIVLMIDEADYAAGSQVFLDFLSQLRGYYIKRRKKAAFHSVILSSVYDVKNRKHRLRQDDNQTANSPWNIAADFRVDMSFSAADIAGMLGEYEADFCTGMDVEEMAGLIYEYTSGYPFLVSRICKLMDECVAGQEDYPDKSRAWTREGFLEAVKILLEERNTLFESLIHKLEDYPELGTILYQILFTGKTVPYSPLNKSIETAEMFGFIKNVGKNVVIASRVFEMVLYDYFLSKELLANQVYDAGLVEKNRFITGGRLNMRLVLERFVVHFNDLYKDQDGHFLEEAGRRYFLLYLKPIINGTGNYYIEAETRNLERTDVVVDYRGEQFVIEMKIWRGNAYHTRGEKQLTDYLDYYHLKKGYMVSFCFNQKKEPKVAEILLGDKVLVEAVV